MIWIGCFSSWCTAPTSSLEWFSTRDVAIHILWELVQFQPSYYIICLSFIPKDIPKETQIWSTHVFWSIHSLKIENPPTTKSSAKFETYIHISVCFLFIMWHCLLVWFLCLNWGLIYLGKVVNINAWLNPLFIRIYCSKNYMNLFLFI